MTRGEKRLVRCAALLTAGLLLAPLLTPPAAAAPPPADPAHPIALAIASLRAAQKEDGGFAPAAPLWEAIAALAAAGVPPQTVRSSPTGKTPLDALADRAASGGFRDADDWQAAILALVAAGEDPRDFRGVDYVAEVREGYGAGQFGDLRLVSDDMFAILALRAAGVEASDPQVQAARAVVVANQNLDGGWSGNGGMKGTRSGADLTGIALAALVAAGLPPGSAPIQSGLAYLKTRQATDGGFYFDNPDDPASSVPDVQATAYALHGLLAAGEDPEAGAWRVGGLSPFDFLWGQQDGTGAFLKGGARSAWATAQAIVPLTGARFPLAPLREAQLTLPVARVGVPATLEARFSDGTATAVTWRVGDRPVVTAAPSLARTFASPGEVPVSVAVFDDAGRRGFATGLVSVLPALDPRLATADATVPRMAPVRFDASASRDPSGGPVEYRFDFGDGTVTAWGRDPVASHSFSSPGAARVTLLLRGSDGAVASAATSLNVTNAAPVARLVAPAQVDRVTPATLVAAVVDPEGDAVQITWSVDGEPAGTGAEVTRAFGRLGAHRVEVTATDAFGAIARAEATVTVVNLPPIVHQAIATPADPPPGAAISFLLDAEDPEGTLLNVTWSVDGKAFGWGPVAAVAFEKPGNHRVGYVVTDGEGGRVEDTLDVVVRPQHQGTDAPAHAAPTAPPAEPGPPPLGEEPRPALPNEPKPSPPAEEPVGKPNATQRPLPPPPALVVAVHPPRVLVGEPVTVTAQAAAAGGRILRLDPGERFTRTFDSAGNHTVTVTVTDEWGRVAEASSVVEVIVPPAEAVTAAQVPAAAVSEEVAAEPPMEAAAGPAKRTPFPLALTLVAGLVAVALHRRRG